MTQWICYPRFPREVASPSLKFLCWRCTELIPQNKHSLYHTDNTSFMLETITLFLFVQSCLFLWKGVGSEGKITESVGLQAHAASLQAFTSTANKCLTVMKFALWNLVNITITPKTQPSFTVLYFRSSVRQNSRRAGTFGGWFFTEMYRTRDDWGNCTSNQSSLYTTLCSPWHENKLFHAVICFIRENQAFVRNNVHQLSRQCSAIWR